MQGFIVVCVGDSDGEKLTPLGRRQTTGLAEMLTPRFTGRSVCILSSTEPWMYDCARVLVQGLLAQGVQLTQMSAEELKSSILLYENPGPLNIAAIQLRDDRRALDLAHTHFGADFVLILAMPESTQNLTELFNWDLFGRKVDADKLARGQACITYCESRAVEVLRPEAFSRTA